MTAARRLTANVTRQAGNGWQPSWPRKPQPQGANNDGQLRLYDPELIESMDSFIDDRDVPPTKRLMREEALLIVQDWLQGQGYVALPEGESVTPVTPASRVPSDV